MHSGGACHIGRVPEMGERSVSADGYPVGDALPVAVGAFDPGMNLLVTGPAMSGKRRLVFDLLTPSGSTDPVLVVTTDDPAERIRARLDERGVDDPERVRIVDASGAPDPGEEMIHSVSSPSDLTGMGVGFTESVDDLGRPPRLRLGFHSVSTLLRYVDADQAFSFLHVLSRRTSAAGYLGVFAIDPTTHDDPFVNQVTSIFDVAIDLREREGVREIRVRGLPGVGSEWMAATES
jgi:KaiC/GvpD/RAD55 family RecA-like ATPase